MARLIAKRSSWHAWIEAQQTARNRDANEAIAKINDALKYNLADIVPIIMTQEQAAIVLSTR